MYKQILTDEKLKTGKKCQKTEQAGRSPLRRPRSTLDCSAIYEGELDEEICLISLQDFDPLQCLYLIKHIKTVYKEFILKIMIYFHTKFHILSSNSSLTLY